MPDEQAVVPDAKTDDYIQLAAGTVEQLGLRQRVADRLEVAGADLLLVLEPDLFLRYATVLAGDRGDFQAVALEDGTQHARQIHEAVV